ncbi:phosphoglycerol transferase [Clostridia bacterium]|nr:phosphoglycerol transferase [Clostridia bacterium]
MRSMFIKKPRTLRKIAVFLRRLGIRIPTWAIFLVLPYFAVGLTYLTFYLQYNGKISNALQTAWSPPFFMNMLPILLTLVFLMFASGRIGVALPVTTLLFAGLSIVNRLKVEMRNDPFMPDDIFSGREAMSILTSQNQTIVFKLIGIFLLFALAVFVLLVFVRESKMHFVVRIAGTLAFVGVALAVNNKLYKDTAYYMSFPVDNPNFTVSRYNSNGFVYSFLYQINQRGATPEEYSKRGVEKAMAGYPQKLNYAGVHPNVIMFMSEAFSDLSDNPHFDFSNYEDPLKNFNKIRKDSMSGYMLVSGTGGGTADTEFDVLTGMSRREIDNVQYAYRLINRPTEGVANALAQLNYYKIFVHPGHPWFYNRANVYRFLGFDEIKFDEYFAGAPMKGGEYINEDDSMDGFIQLFREKLYYDAPVFEYCVNIQNHGPYPGKYGDWQKNFDTDLALPDGDVDILSNYFEGVIDVDRNLKKLTDYLDTVDEPVLLVYFGDHMPSMPIDTFNDLDFEFSYDGDFEHRVSIYKTPYIFWQNKTYRDIDDFSKRDNSADALMSSSFIGAKTLDLIGEPDATPFFSFLNSLRKSMPVVTKYEYVEANGTYRTYETLTPEEHNRVMLYKNWQHYILYEH